MDECDTFFDAYCGRYAACAVETGASAGKSEATAKEECVNKQEVVTCDQAIGVSPTYNACVDEIKTLNCNQIILAEQGNEDALPADCQGAIRILQ